MIFWNKLEKNKAKYTRLANEVGIKLMFSDRRWIDSRFDTVGYSAIEFIIRLAREHAYLDRSYVSENEYKTIAKFHLANKIAIPFSRRFISEYIIKSADTSVILNGIASINTFSGGYFTIEKQQKDKPLAEWLDLLMDFFPSLNLEKTNKIRLNVDQNGIIDSYSVFDSNKHVAIANHRIPIFCHVKDRFYELGTEDVLVIDDMRTDRLVHSNLERDAQDVEFSFNIPNISHIVVSDTIGGIRHIRIPSKKINIRSDSIKIVSEIVKYTFKENTEYTVNGGLVEDFIVDKIVYGIENKHDTAVYKELMSSLPLLPVHMKSIIMCDNRIVALRSYSIKNILSRKQIDEIINDRATVFEKMMSASKIYPVAKETDSKGTTRHYFFNTTNGAFVRSAITPNEIRKNIIPLLGGSKKIVAEYYGETPDLDAFNKIEKAAVKELTMIYVESASKVPKVKHVLSRGVHRVDGKMLVNTGINVIHKEEDIDFKGCIPMLNSEQYAALYPQKKREHRISKFAFAKMVSNLKLFLEDEDDAEILAASMLATIILPALTSSTTSVINLFNGNPKRMDLFSSDIIEQSIRLVHRYKNKIGNVPSKVQNGVTFPVSTYNKKGKNTSFLKFISTCLPIDVNNIKMRHGGIKSSTPLIAFGVRRIMSDDSCVINFRLKSFDKTLDTVQADDLSNDMMNYALNHHQALRLAERRMFLLQNRKSVQAFGFRKARLNNIFKAITPTLIILEYLGYDKMEKAIPLLLEKFIPKEDEDSPL